MDKKIFSKKKRKRIKCKLPMNMTPNKSSFESIGFKFKKSFDKHSYKTYLPEGWSLNPDEKYLWIYFYDEKGRKRGAYFDHSPSFYGRISTMYLSAKFRTTYDFIDETKETSLIRVCVKDTDDNIIYTAGECMGIYSMEYYDLNFKAMDYLNTNYPDWNNPTKYWD